MKSSLSLRFSWFKLPMLVLAFVARAAMSCEYCASTSPVCVAYEDVCASYSTQCTSSDYVCDSYEDVCTNYEYYCNAYDDNGDCVSYGTECTNYESQCASYSYQCTNYQYVCDYYDTRCSQYDEQCDSYYYGDYVTVNGTITSADTGNFVKNATISHISDTDTDTVYTNSGGRYTSTMFVYDDASGYLNTRVCAASASASATVCRNISVYDSCSSQSVTHNMALDLDRLPEPYNLTVQPTSHTSLTPSWSSNSGNITGFYVAWTAGFLAPDCRSGVDVGYVSSYLISNLTPLTFYSISVCAHDSNGNVSLEALSSQTTKRAPPPAPYGLTLSSSTTSEASASWISGGGSTSGFYVAIAQGASPASCSSGTDVGSGLAAVANGLQPGTQYTYSVCSYDAYGNLSEQISGLVRTRYLPPPPPTSLTVSSDTASKLTARWSSGGGSTSSYLVNYAVGNVAPGCAGGTSVSTLFKALTGLNPLTAYSVSVCASNPDGVTSSSISATQTTKRLPPPAPISLVMTAVSPYEISLSWTTGAGATTGFMVAHAQGNTAPDCNLGLDVGAATTHSLTGLQGLTTYSVAICAYDAFVDSDSSAPLTGSKATLRAPPPAPTNFAVVASSPTQLNVSWLSGGGSTTAFFYKHALGTTPPDCKVGTNIGLVTSKSITGLVANTTYSVSLCAKDNFGLYSTQVSAVQTTKRNPPPAPTSLTLTAASDTVVNVTWKSGAGSTAKFFVAVAQGTSYPDCSVGTDVGNVLNHSATGLLANTQYSFSVCANDGFGNNSNKLTGRKTTLRTPPPPPSNISVTSDSTSKLTVRWSAAGGTTSGYKIARAVSPAIPDCKAGSYLGNVLSHSATGLAANTLYNFSLCSYDAYLTYSSPVTASERTMRNPPAVPGSFAIAATSDTELTATWRASGGLTTGYFLAYALGATAPVCTTGTDIGNVTRFVISGLLPNTKYTASICAYDDISLYSLQTVKTQTTKRTPPPAPSGLVFSNITTTAMTLSWTSGGGSTTGFRLARATGTVAPNCATASGLGNVFTKVVTRLVANTNYTYALCSYDAYGNNSTSVIGTQTTLRNPPPKPTTLAFTGVLSTEMTITWRSGLGSTAGYFVNVVAGTVAPNCLSGSDVGAVTSFHPTGLIPNTVYAVSICSYDGFGNNSAGLTGTKRTLP